MDTSPGGKDFVPSEFSPDAAESFWFGLTSKGRSSLK